MRPNSLLSPIAFPSLFRALLLTWMAAVACDAQTFPKSENEKAFRGCLPVSDQTSEIGCWILKTESVGKLPGGSDLLVSLPVSDNCSRRGGQKAVWHRDRFRGIRTSVADDNC